MEKILVVEDNTSAKNILGKMIKKMGFEIIHASNGVEAWEYLSSCESAETEYPVTIITDIFMPQMDGKTFIKKIAHHPLFSIIPIIAISAGDEETIGMESLKSGALSFIQKPVKYDELNFVVNNHVRLHKFFISQKRLSDFRGQILDAIKIEGRGKKIDVLDVASKARKIMRNTLHIPGDPRIVYIGEEKEGKETPVASHDIDLVGQGQNYVITQVPFKAIVSNSCDSDQLSGVLDLLRYIGSIIEKGLIEQRKLLAEKRTKQILNISSENLKKVFASLQREIDEFVSKKDMNNLSNVEIKHLSFLESQVLQKLQLLVFDLAKVSGREIDMQKWEKLQMGKSSEDIPNFKDIQKEVDSIIEEFGK